MNRLNIFEDKEANMGALLQIRCKQCSAALCQGADLFKIGELCPFVVYCPMILGVCIGPIVVTSHTLIDDKIVLTLGGQRSVQCILLVSCLMAINAQY
jgi:hypothetical protein